MPRLAAALPLLVALAAVPVAAASPGYAGRLEPGPVVRVSSLPPVAAAPEALVSPARSLAAGGAPFVRASFPGLDFTLSGFFEPPDVQVAAGPGTVMEMVNVAGRVWLTGAGPAQPLPPFLLGSLFGTGTRSLSDPRLLYDAPSRRWFASVFDEDRSTVQIAVSKSSDPSGAWATYGYSAPSCPDQPHLGVADHVIVLSADEFSSCERGAELGGLLWVLNKDQLIAGGGVDFRAFGPDAAFTSYAPVQSLGPTDTEYVVSVDDKRSARVHLFALKGVPPAAVTPVQIASLPIALLRDPPPARQPDPRSLIETNDSRILDAAWEGGKLWFAANGACTPTGDAAVRSCARIVALGTDPPRVLQDSDLESPGVDLFFPALRPDTAGNVDIVYGFSSPDLPPGLAAVSLAPDGSFSAPAVVANSRGSYNGRRFGDYFGAARDPSDPSVVWVAGEIASGGFGGGWRTVVAAVSTVAAPATPAAPLLVDTQAPRLRALPARGNRGTRIRLSYRVSDDSGASRERVTVSHAGRTVFARATRMTQVDASQTYAVEWGAPRKGTGYRFCVRATDPSGNASVPSCAKITLR